MRDSKLSALGRNALLALGSLALVGCEPPAEQVEQPSGIQSGIWLLAGSEHAQSDIEDPCRPMLMRVNVTTAAVTLERRVFLCYSQKYSFDRISFVRDGTTLRIGEQIMGSISERKLEVDLPFAAGTISWDLDREYQTYRENSPNGLFVAYPQLRPDSAPVASPLSYYGKTSLPLVGRLHAARLPETSITYGVEDSLAHCQLVSLDPVTGIFRLEPNPGFAGFDSFSFWPLVNNQEFPRETVKIQFTGKPELPQGLDLEISVLEDSPTDITPEVVNLDSIEYKLEIVDSPSHGQVVVEESSQGTRYFVYTPDPNYNGPDSFSYISDAGQYTGKKAAVNIAVVPVNDPPIGGDLSIQVTRNDATPIQLPVTDLDSSIVDFSPVALPLHGTLSGNFENLIYTPNPNFTGEDTFKYVVFDSDTASGEGVVKITVVPGDYPSQILAANATSEVTPVWSDLSTVYFAASFNGAPTSIGMVGFGFTWQVLQEKEFDTLGFDSLTENPSSTSFFNLDGYVYFSNSTITAGVRFYRAAGLTASRLVDIPAPSSNILSKPAVGTAYLEGNIAFFPIHWQTPDSNYICQIWRISSWAVEPDLIQSFPAAKTPCFGMKSFGAAQYLLAGSNLVQFPDMYSPPIFVKDLGNAEPLPWLVEAGGKLFFQTRTLIQGDVQVDLWVTDGTSAGTQVVKQIEKTANHFDIISSLAFSDKLYFAHKKSLWSSDGTAAGTNIVKTMDVTNVIGDGAIGKISAFGGRLYFLATSDMAGREPWISDGSPAGTSLLRDIRGGAVGSSVPSTNPAYFQDWNGKIYFLANDGAESFGLWTTDGTFAGTKLLKKRDMTTIVGFHNDKLVYHYGENIFAMTLQ